MGATASYNERLFSGGLRGMLHTARFRWLRRTLDELACRPRSVVELGCFDGKALRYLPARPERYVGLDANWEGGLDLARGEWRHAPNVAFRECHAPEDLPAGESFDVAICMETLEHVPPDALPEYVERLAALAGEYLLVTVPVEKGLVFAAKHLAHRLMGQAEPYTLGEFVNATLGRTSRVRRREHKGFDYETVVELVARHADIVEVAPIPFRRLPRALGFGVAIVARARSCGRRR